MTKHDEQPKQRLVDEGSQDEKIVAKDGGKFQRLANTIRRSGPAPGSSRPAPEPDS